MDQNNNSSKPKPTITRMNPKDLDELLTYLDRRFPDLSYSTIAQALMVLILYSKHEQLKNEPYEVYADRLEVAILAHLASVTDSLAATIAANLPPTEVN